MEGDLGPEVNVLWLIYIYMMMMMTLIRNVFKGFQTDKVYIGNHFAIELLRNVHRVVGDSDTDSRRAKLLYVKALTMSAACGGRSATLVRRAHQLLNQIVSL